MCRSMRRDWAAAIHEIYHRHSDYLRPGADLRPLDEYESVGDVWDPAVPACTLGRNPPSLSRPPA